MKNKKTFLTTTLFLLIAILAGCSSSANREKKLLPDEGPTTAELVTGTTTENSYFGGETAPYYGKPLMGGYTPSSSYSAAHIQELKRDFQQVPNPEIVGYVYPHINNNSMPIPGYFTTFRLYSRDHYALSSEGYRE